MEFFVHGRDNPGTAALREAVNERHQSFMDAFVDRMIARGPTYTDDGSTPTGSMHIVDLRDADEARMFAFEEPYYRAGVFRDVTVSRWQNQLGGTMWTNAVDGLDSDRFLVVCDAMPGLDVPGDGLPADHPYGDHLVVFGPLVSDDGSRWGGTVLALERVERSAVEAMLADDPFARAGRFESVEIHRWYFGGRR